MSVRNVLSCFAFLIILSSCAPKLQYAITAPFGKDVFKARTGKFSGKVPEGWFTSTDTATTKSLEAWLIRNDLSAAIVFRELQFDQAGNEFLAKQDLEDIAELSEAFSLTDSSKLVSPSKEYSIGDYDFCSYEVKAGIATKRFVVFKTNGRFFESEASTVKGNWTPVAITELFTVQQSVLSSLQFPKGLP